MEYATPSPDSDDLLYQTPTATILVGAIKEITSISQTVMFPDGYSGGISTWSGCEDSADWTFHEMVLGFLRLEEFGEQGPTEVSQ